MRKVLLCIMDGIGINENSYGNAFMKASTSNIDYLLKTYPNSTLVASGEQVGLPSGQMGNSEVGHSNIGGGRIVYQSLMYINERIKDKSFFENKKLIEAINRCKKNKSKLHLMGLISDGGIHSHIDHLMAILDLIDKNDFSDVYLHLFTDGRDTDIKSSVSYLDKVSSKLKQLGFGKIATISGRYYAMDRDNNFDRIKKAYDVIVEGNGRKFNSYNELIKHNYDNDIYDEFIEPGIIDESGKVEDNDSIIVFNFREDRVIELFSSITNKAYDKFERIIRNNIYLVSMMEIGKTIVGDYAFKLDEINDTLGEVVSNNKLTQLRIAETEKYYHVTYFFDGCKNIKLNGCKKIMIPSPKVATYDLKPEMSAIKITNKLLEEIDKKKPDLVVLNFANGDMVGHTGNFDSAVEAVETVDLCIGKIYNTIKDEYTLVVTADHGNCEVMINEDGSVNTNHTTNLVPFIITDKSLKLENGKLGDIAPTILELMDLKIPKSMSGNVLIKR